MNFKILFFLSGFYILATIGSIGLFGIVTDSIKVIETIENETCNNEFYNCGSISTPEYILIKPEESTLVSSNPDRCQKLDYNENNILDPTDIKQITDNYGLNCTNKSPVFFNPYMYEFDCSQTIDVDNNGKITLDDTLLLVNKINSQCI